ncbi:MAG: YegS/Rv2252/BmrU family lipid kinase [Candidatus Dojkabacteria bacterium]|nr:MAG: YegS/Rv2252/BmrU family lipid kinase [Candidatus Dojkabacteria bacterium]
MSKRIELIVNPISGKPEPILYYINKALNEDGTEWNLHITKKSGDVESFVKKLLPTKPDAIAVYGGDGTVMSAAQYLIDSPIPLAIIPGGSANLLSKDLMIPQDSQAALALLSRPKSEWRYTKVDMGRLGDGSKFILRVGMGFAADKVKMASREMKERFGMLAYSVAGVQAFKAGKEIEYNVEVDGEKFVEKGYSCSILNSGNMGIGQLNLSNMISPSDGYLDLVIFKTRNFAKLLEQRFVSKKDLDDFSDTVTHRRGKKIRLTVEHQSDIQVDGELISGNEIVAEVMPQVVKILVP